MPRVSIITPVFNGADYLPEAISSVFAQSETDWEWLIVNDGSTDGTAAFLDALTETRCRVLHQDNAGVSAARNAALAQASGQYITFLDADDLLPPDALSIRAAFLDANLDIDIVNGGVTVTENGQEVRRYDPSCQTGALLSRLAVLGEEVFFGPFYMLRGDRIAHHRFPVGISHCEDLIFFLSLAHDADLQYGAVPDVVYEYRVTPGSAMSNLDGIESGYMALLETARRLPRLEKSEFRVLQRRISSILAKSWLRKGKPHRAMAAAARVYRHHKDF